MRQVLRDIRDGVLLVEYPDLSEADANRAAVALARRLGAAVERGLLDAVPAARTLLAVFDPARLSRGRLADAIDAQSRPCAEDAPSRLLRIPAVYGGADTAELASALGVSAEEYARRHAAAEYRVAFIGFSPGFPYLIGLPPELHAARLTSPRPRVAAGSLAIGGPYTGIYPAETPGGWRLIGQTSVCLYDASAESPALLAAGDRVRFEAIEPGHLPAPRPPRRAPPLGPPIFRLGAPGLFTSAQGAPRYGLGTSGVPPGGAMDLASLASANGAVGNTPWQTALEITLLGPELEVLHEATIAVAGGELGLERNGRAFAPDEALRVAPGDLLRLSHVRRGARAYLAVRGGLCDPRLPGEPTRRLAAGEEVVLLADAPGQGERSAIRIEPGAEILLRVIPGPQVEHFVPAELERFLASSWRVSAESDRRGLRLEGARLEHERAPEIPPEGTVAGSIQVPGNGQPIVLGPDGPVTGGYPKIATVIGADLALLGQAPPGAFLRFQAASLEQALGARRALREYH